MTKLRVVNARTPEQWAEIIQAAWQDSVKGIMDVGLKLSNSREELGTAEFWKMARAKLGYSDAAVKQLIQVGTDTRLMEALETVTLGNGLPASWTILYALTRLTNEQFQRGLDTGIIHAGMERKDVSLLKPPKEKQQPPSEPVLTGRELIEHHAFEARKQIVTALREFNYAEQLEFIALVRFQLDDLEKSRKAA
jgi:hypothetical protein